MIQYNLKVVVLPAWLDERAQRSPDTINLLELDSIESPTIKDALADMLKLPKRGDNTVLVCSEKGITCRETLIDRLSERAYLFKVAETLSLKAYAIITDNAVSSAALKILRNMSEDERAFFTTFICSVLRSTGVNNFRMLIDPKKGSLNMITTVPGGMNLVNISYVFGIIRWLPHIYKYMSEKGLPWCRRSVGIAILELLKEEVSVGSSNGYYGESQDTLFRFAIYSLLQQEISNRYTLFGSTGPSSYVSNNFSPLHWFNALSCLSSTELEAYNKLIVAYCPYMSDPQIKLLYK